MNAGESERFHKDFEHALAFATRLHALQKRKKTDIPYISHLIGVAGLVLEHVGNRDEAIAALLHDSIEDQAEQYPGGAERLRQSIREHYGAQVLANVESCTDTNESAKSEWRERKERYIAHLAEAAPSAWLVSCADKLHNARSILADLRRVGAQAWQRFNGGREGTL